jgi:hypothetical protein
MKFIYPLIVTLACLFNSQNSYSQAPQGALELPELNVLYRGYPNKVVPAVTNNNGLEVGLEGLNCSVSKYKNSNYYIVKPGKGRKAVISIVLIDGDSIITIKRMEFRVSNLPDPVLYWGSAKAGTKANMSSRLIRASYPPEIPLKANFRVVKWTFTTETDTCSGESHILSPAGDLIKQIDKPSTVKISASVIGPDGISRRISGEWSVDKWIEAKPRKKIEGCG